VLKDKGRARAVWCGVVSEPSSSVMTNTSIHLIHVVWTTSRRPELALAVAMDLTTRSLPPNLTVLVIVRRCQLLRVHVYLQCQQSEVSLCTFVVTP
jgi:hypothetical protein